MSIFSKTTNVYGETYYIIDGKIYKFTCEFPESDGALPVVELLNKYGFCVSKYDMECNVFADWASAYYRNLDEVPYDMTKAKEFTKMTLDDAISTVEKEFEKKFKDFPLDGTLYTSKSYDNGCFRAIAKPVRKLLNTYPNNAINSMILEVEILDGLSAETRREFMSFYNFIGEYTPGCTVEVIESIHPDDSYSNIEIEDYFNL
jgi:hypothetical protein